MHHGRLCACPSRRSEQLTNQRAQMPPCVDDFASDASIAPANQDKEQEESKSEDDKAEVLRPTPETPVPKLEDCNGRVHVPLPSVSSS